MNKIGSHQLVSIFKSRMSTGNETVLTTDCEKTQFSLRMFIQIFSKTQDI